MLSCEDRVRIVAQVAVDCAFDHELASMVLEFLLQVCSTVLKIYVDFYDRWLQNRRRNFEQTYLFCIIYVCDNFHIQYNKETY